MKKGYILVAVILVAAMLLAACTPELDAMEQLQQAYNGITNATSIEQAVTISQGTLVQYKSERTYTKQDTDYKVTGKITRLNTLDSETWQDEQEINETVQSAATAVPSLHLNASYFEADYTLNETGLTAKVPSAHIKDVLTLTDTDMPAPVTDLTLSLTLTSSQLTTLAISYTSSGSNVRITIAFTY